MTNLERIRAERSECAVETILPLLQSETTSISYDMVTKLVYRNEQRIGHLNNAQHAVLIKLLLHPDAVCSPETIYAAWNPNGDNHKDVSDKARQQRIVHLVDTTISNFRKYLATIDPALEFCIENIWGSGYMYNSHPSVAKGPK